MQRPQCQHCRSHPLSHLPYAHADRLVSVGIVTIRSQRSLLLGYFYYDWQRGQKPFHALALRACHDRGVRPDGEKPGATGTCTSVEGNFLPTLGVSPVLERGREKNTPNGRKVALISYGLWLSHYNLDRRCLNKTIDIDGDPVQVVEVLPKTLRCPDCNRSMCCFPCRQTKWRTNKVKTWTWEVPDEPSPGSNLE